jgi:predicted Fe-Mo cluster-binding NifX family protein
MKIAVVSDDQSSISQHFGRANYYVVYKTENGKVLSKETRSKSVHHNINAPSGFSIGNECHHGYGAGAHIRHKGMTETISDCTAMIAGGMGWGAYESLKNQNIDTVITDVKDMDQAVELYLTDNLPNLMQRLH